MTNVEQKIAFPIAQSIVGQPINVDSKEFSEQLLGKVEAGKGGGCGGTVGGSSGGNCQGGCSGCKK